MLAGMGCNRDGSKLTRHGVQCWARVQFYVVVGYLENYVFYPMLIRDIENADVPDEVVDEGGCVVRWV